jgi:hypothetical protein
MHTYQASVKVRANNGRSQVAKGFVAFFKNLIASPYSS